MVEKDKLSDEAKEKLCKMYGKHPYDYEMSDFNMKSILGNNTPQTFEELDKRARKLEAVIRHIHEMQEKMER